MNNNKYYLILAVIELNQISNLLSKHEALSQPGFVVTIGFEAKVFIGGGMSEIETAYDG